MKTYLIKLIRNICNVSSTVSIKKKIVTRNLFISMISIFLLSQITAINLVNATTEYPNATDLKYVNDYGKVIDSKSAEYILSVGKELEAKTGVQATVVVIASLQGQTIESYATGIFRSFGIGQKDTNNGLLILLSMEEKNGE